MNDLLERLLPILIVLIIGVVLRKTQAIAQEVVDGMKTIILKVGLPIVLFSAFGKASIEISYIFLFIIVFGMCIILYAIGYICSKYMPKLYDSKYTSGYFTGFEFGMVGIGLFTALWGVEKLPIILMIGFGHEIFIWFIYVPLLEYKKTGQMNFVKTLISFIKSPIIIAILGGILANLLQVYGRLDSNFIGRSLLNTINMLSGIVSPLILIIIGYAMTFKAIPIKKAIAYIVGRWITVMVMGCAVLWLILLILPNADSFFIKAFFAFLILPPPFILPLFIKKEAVEEQSFFSELIIYHTMTSFLGYIVLMLI